MTTPSYEYHGLMATTWDLFRGDTSQWEDRFFYLDVVTKYGGPVLDVGCGTGRILLDFITQGVDIDGVDNSPDMLALVQGKSRENGREAGAVSTGDGQALAAAQIPDHPRPFEFVSTAVGRLRCRPLPLNAYTTICSRAACSPCPS